MYILNTQIQLQMREKTHKIQLNLPEEAFMIRYKF